jgi:hypothetical protein
MLKEKKLKLSNYNIKFISTISSIPNTDGSTSIVIVAMNQVKFGTVKCRKRNVRNEGKQNKIQ